MTKAPKEAQHRAPAWRDRANFVVGARLPEAGRSEQLWARQISDHTFEVCGIPFYLYDIALGDVVQTDEKYDVVKVLEHSGRYVFRVWFGKTLHSHEKIIESPQQLGALLEWCSDNYLAIDAKNLEQAQRISGYLREEQSEGRLQYETGADRTPNGSNSPNAPAVNRAGRPYPQVIDPRTGEPIPLRLQDYRKYLPKGRVPWDGRQQRGKYIKEWYDRGHSTPESGWEKCDAHHIVPRAYGGTNEFMNLVPVLRPVHQMQFTPWWMQYG